MNILKPYGGIPGVCAECGIRYKGEFAHSCATGQVIGYCEDCKHWEPDYGGYCTIIRARNSCRLASIEADSGASLRTDPKFGCVQWEAK